MSTSKQRNTKRTTTKDVAGVSVTTVSNTLNGRTMAMAEETRRRIQQTIYALNYRPNNVARSLATQQTTTTGVIVAEIDTSLFLQALNIIESTARSTDDNVLLCTTAKDLHAAPHPVNLLLEKQADGILKRASSLSKCY